MQGWCRKSVSKHIVHNSKNVLCRLTVKSLCVAGLRVAQDAMHQHACFVRHRRQDHCKGTVIYKHTIFCHMMLRIAQEVFKKTCS